MIRHVTFSQSVFDNLLSFIYKKRLTILRSLLVLVASLVSALTINPPTVVTSGGTISISWVTAAGDPYVNQTLTLSPPSYGVSTSSTWMVELLNPELNYPIVIANNVDVSHGYLTRQCPIVPSGYVIHSCYHDVCALFLSHHPVTAIPSKLLTTLSPPHTKFSLRLPHFLLVQLTPLAPV